MPLGIREGDTSKTRNCGVEIKYDFIMHRVISYNIRSGGFDFVVTPLIDPRYRPSLWRKHESSMAKHKPHAQILRVPYVKSDRTVHPAVWKVHVVGKISPWIDLDSEDGTLKLDSETVLKQEIAYASYHSLQ
ncbi:PRMT5, TIM barrel domain, partial [Sesbania bispinosa]